MSGVMMGSRLEQLQELQTQLAQEIAQERRRLALDDRVTRARIVTPVVRTEPADATRLRELHVDVRTVRAWAQSVGLPVSKRGRVSVPIIEAFAEAHPMQRVTA